ncbi:hypothetical protein B0H10DRAFT_2191595 [Mycena sp. CBHHK59/15]|nr:hypothetical protein B0H10DRAFT_2191595 [Mycena sp. CBHHK59/15]
MNEFWECVIEAVRPLADAPVASNMQNSTEITLLANISDHIEPKISGNGRVLVEKYPFVRVLVLYQVVCKCMRPVQPLVLIHDASGSAVLGGIRGHTSAAMAQEHPASNAIMGIKTWGGNTFDLKLMISWVRICTVIPGNVRIKPAVHCLLMRDQFGGQRLAGRETALLRTWAGRLATSCFMGILGRFYQEYMYNRIKPLIAHEFGPDWGRAPWQRVGYLTAAGLDLQLDWHIANAVKELPDSQETSASGIPKAKSSANGRGNRDTCYPYLRGAIPRHADIFHRVEKGPAAQLKKPRPSRAP